MLETFISFIKFVSVLTKVSKAIAAGINKVEKFIDNSGRVFTRFIKQFDTTGDGVFDSEEVFYSLPLSIPNLENGFCLVNNGNEIGLGYPLLKLVDAQDIISSFNSSGSFSLYSDFGDVDIVDTVEVISDGDGFLVDFDDDGATDDIFYPAPIDYTGDGIDDYYQIVDSDDNGLPDVAPGGPFYPTGSDEYQQIVESQSSNVPALDKNFKNYTVTEALLFLIFVGSAVAMISKIFKRRKL